MILNIATGLRLAVWLSLYILHIREATLVVCFAALLSSFSLRTSVWFNYTKYITMQLGVQWGWVGVKHCLQLSRTAGYESGLGQWVAFSGQCLHLYVACV